MATFKSVAYEVLKDAGRPLHTAEIWRRARARGVLTEGKSPVATMAAALYVDVNANGNKSPFVRTPTPATFAANPRYIPPSGVRAATSELKYPLAPDLSATQKGNIAEARIAELITLYGPRQLTCFRPDSDDEGIDLIVKEKGAFGGVVYLQVKSRFGADVGTQFQATARRPQLADRALAFVFCRFDTDKGDLTDSLWFIPAPAFVAAANPLKKNKVWFRGKYNAEVREQV